MTTYTLRFDAGAAAPAMQIVFDAVDAGDALMQAHREARDRSAELWHGERKLCSIRRAPGRPVPVSV